MNLWEEFFHKILKWLCITYTHKKSKYDHMNFSHWNVFINCLGWLNLFLFSVLYCLMMFLRLQGYKMVKLLQSNFFFSFISSMETTKLRWTIWNFLCCRYLDYKLFSSIFWYNITYKGKPITLTFTSNTI